MKKTKIIFAFIIFFVYFGLFFHGTINTSEQTVPKASDPKASIIPPPYKYEWHDLWGGSENDWAQNMLIDSFGNIFVAGSTGSGASYDFFLLKYNYLGDLLWSRVLIGGFCYGMAIDSMDNIYLVGSSGENTCVVKCNNSGDIEWSDIWNGGVGVAIAIDSNDDVFITGFSVVSNPTYNYQFLLIKYTSDGEFQWYQNWGNEKDDLLEAIVIDDNDNIYMAGLVDGENGDGNITVFKRNNSGVISWSRMWGGTDSERAYAISLDSLDNVYVGGWSQSYGSRRGVVLKYTSEGSFQWSKLKHSECRDIFVDSLDGIYATGFGSGDFTLVKYSSLGEEELEFTWGSEGSDTSFSGAVDSWGNIYITGATEGFGASETDNCLVRFSRDSDGDNLTDQDELTVYFTDPNNDDSDGDEVLDGEEVLTHGTDPLNDDTDSDGMTDGWEIKYSLNPLVNDMMLDPDQDSLTNIQEFILGTDPTNPDTDSDGISDGDEVTNNTDPLDPNDPPRNENINGYSVMVITVVIFISTFVLIRKRRKLFMNN